MLRLLAGLLVLPILTAGDREVVLFDTDSGLFGDDGAALVTLCEEPFGKSDAAGLARLHALEAALRPIQS